MIDDLIADEHPYFLDIISKYEAGKYVENPGESNCRLDSYWDQLFSQTGKSDDTSSVEDRNVQQIERNHAFINTSLVFQASDQSEGSIPESSSVNHHVSDEDLTSSDNIRENHQALRNTQKWMKRKFRQYWVGVLMGYTVTTCSNIVRYYDSVELVEQNIHRNSVYYLIGVLLVMKIPFSWFEFIIDILTQIFMKLFCFILRMLGKPDHWEHMNFQSADEYLGIWNFRCFNGALEFLKIIRETYRMRRDPYGWFITQFKKYWRGVLIGLSAASCYFIYSNFNTKSRTRQVLLYAAILQQISVIILAMVPEEYYENLIRSLLQSIESFLTTLGLRVESNDNDVEGLSLLDRCKNTISDIRSIQNSEFLKHVVELLSLFVCIVTFKWSGYDQNKLTMSLAASLFASVFATTDKCVNIFDALISVIDKCQKAYETGTIFPSLFSCSDYVEWANTYETLSIQSHQLHDPESYGFSESTFMGQIDEAIEKGEQLIKYSSKLNTLESRILKTRLKDLKMIRSNFVSQKAARQDREAPFSLLITGPSSIGKSTIKTILFQHFGKKQNLETSSNYCYSRNSAANFWDGFRSSQWCVVLDDIASLRVEKSNGVDPSLLEVLNVINQVPYVPDQADLENKGKVPMRAKLVIATTNTEHLNSFAYFACPSAVQRRFKYVIEPVVRSEYADCNGNLDSSKTLSDEYPDYWSFTVKRTIPQPKDRKREMADFETVLNDANMRDFLLWYNSAIDKHVDGQRVVQDSLLVIAQAKICECHDLPTNLCAQMQSYDLSIIQGVVETSIGFGIFVFLLRITDLLRVRHQLLVRLENVLSTSSRFWNNIGEQATTIRRSFRLKLFVGLLLILSSLYICYTKVVATISAGFQTDNTDERNPNADLEERFNPWYSADITMNSYDMSNESKCMKGRTVDEFQEMIDYNLVHIKLQRSPLVTRNFRAICVTSNVYMCNKHSFPEEDEAYNITVTCRKSIGVDLTVSLTLHKKNLTYVDNNDMVFFTILALPPRKSLIRYFPLDKYDPRCEGYLIGRLSNGDYERRHYKSVRLENVNNDEFGIRGFLLGGRINIDTKIGDCGSALCINSPSGWTISGFHVLGKPGYSWSVGVTQSMIESAIQDMEVSHGINSLSLHSKDIKNEIIMLHKKSVFRYIPEGAGEIYGSFAGFRTKPKSRVGPTLIRHLLSDKEYPSNYHPPLMNGYKPWRMAALDMVSPNMDVDPEYLCEAEISYMTHVTQYTSDIKAMVHKYTCDAAINGAPGVAYVDAINRKSSMGYPWNCPKKKYYRLAPANHAHLDPIVFDEEIMERIRFIEESYKRGERVRPVFKAHLKDEPVTLKKKISGKTRVFMGAPIDFTIVVRKYLMGFIRFCQNKRHKIECGPGTVAQSREWGDLYEYLTAFGDDRIIAGDFKAFDRTMNIHFLNSAFSIIKEVCRQSGNYTDIDLRVIDCIKEDIIYPTVDYNGDLVSFVGINPSGNPLTVIINGIVNSLYMRYAYVVNNPKHTCLCFNSNVHLQTYGDDNIQGVSEDTPWYNHTAIQSALETIGVIYTMADKEAESVPYVSINGADFLKRSFRFDKDVGDYLPIIKHDTIEKMLTTCVASKTISREEQACDIIHSAIREYFNYGKDIFHKKRKMFQDIIIKAGLESIISPLPTWNSLVTEFKNSNPIAG